MLSIIFIMSITKVSMMKASASLQITSSDDEEEQCREGPFKDDHIDYIKSKKSGVPKKKQKLIISPTENISANKRQNPKNSNDKDGCANGNRILSNNLQESVKNFENDNDLNPKICDGIHQCTADVSLIRTSIFNEYNVIKKHANQTVNKIKTALKNLESTDICNKTTLDNKTELIKFLSGELISVLNFIIENYFNISVNNDILYETVKKHIPSSNRYFYSCIEQIDLKNWLLNFDSALNIILCLKEYSEVNPKKIYDAIIDFCVEMKNLYNIKFEDNGKYVLNKDSDALEIELISQKFKYQNIS